SKDEIVVAAWDHSKLLGAVMLLTALLTAYYAFRLYFRVFEGPEVIPAPPAGGHGQDDHAHGAPADHAHAEAHHNHEPMLMILPLLILAIGAVAAGALNLPGTLFPERISHRLAEFLGNSPSFTLGYDVAKVQSTQWVDPAAWGQLGDERLVSPAHQSIMAASVLIAFLGILLAYANHLQNRAKGDALANRFPALRILLEGKYFVDEIYQAAIVEPLRTLGKAFFWIDRWLVDGLVNTIGFIPQLGGFTLKLTTQRGRLQGYALMMLAGVAAILLLIFI
ncbi:MAG: hypothetical protein ABSH20_16370, partial [Tepidisphaeraceae bacterium]